jgi:hypothetical protein
MAEEGDMSDRPLGFGEQLYRLLPEVYRSRDESGDLRGYLDAFGGVLDLVRDLLEQRLADAFANHPDAQGWTLPYHAELLDARLVSSDDEGRREEIANAIAWRKGKGTLRTVEEIAAALGRFGWSDGDPSKAPWAALLVQEGWGRVAMTPRLPLPAYDDDASRYAATVDLRYCSRRMRTSAPNGRGAFQANPSGVPCFPGTSQDLTRRTPDLRNPTWRAGHAHPSRVLLFVVPHAGFFPPGWDRFPPTGPVREPRLMKRTVIKGDLELDPGPGELFVIEDCIISGTVSVKRGRVKLVRSAVGKLVATGDPNALLTKLPVMTAEDCLFGSLHSQGLAELVAVTVLGELSVQQCHVSDSLLAGTVVILTPPPQPLPRDAPPPFCFRFSRVPPNVLTGFKTFRCVSDPPSFVAGAFGERGCGVLHPISSRALREGAEDGGELGAYHHRRYALRERALLDKLREYLPVGQIAVIVPDDTLRTPPPVLHKKASPL